jgi:hypothetical protein
MFCAKDAESTPFGHKLKEKYFMLALSFTNLNHGSFGATPHMILDEQIRFMQIQGIIIAYISIYL